MEAIKTNPIVFRMSDKALKNILNKGKTCWTVAHTTELLAVMRAKDGAFSSEKRVNQKATDE